jgi:peptide chain release factor 1
MQEERSQLQNRSKAMKLLNARLYELQRQEAQDERSQIRRQQIGTAMRSEKIRTYNFPQDRVTDHRIGKTIHGVQSVLEAGHGLVELMQALQIHYETNALLNLSEMIARK